MTNDERVTDKMKKRMHHYEQRLRTLFEAKTADLASTLQNVDSRYIIDPENEDPLFYEDFMRVIDSDEVKHVNEGYVDKAYRNTEVTSDPYVGMEMAMARGPRERWYMQGFATGCETKTDNLWAWHTTTQC
jgi:hypothetical protein